MKNPQTAGIPTLTTLYTRAPQLYDLPMALRYTKLNTEHSVFETSLPKYEVHEGSEPIATLEQHLTTDYEKVWIAKYRSIQTVFLQSKTFLTQRDAREWIAARHAAADKIAKLLAKTARHAETS